MIKLLCNLRVLEYATILDWLLTFMYRVRDGFTSLQVIKNVRFSHWIIKNVQLYGWCLTVTIHLISLSVSCESNRSDCSMSIESDHKNYNCKCRGTRDIQQRLCKFCRPWAVKTVICYKIIASKYVDSSTSFSPGHSQSNRLVWFPYKLWLWWLCGEKCWEGL